MIPFLFAAGIALAPLAGAVVMARHTRATLVRERMADGIGRAAAEAELSDLLRRRAWRTRRRGLLTFAGAAGVGVANSALLVFAAVHNWRVSKGLVVVMGAACVGWGLAMFALFEVVTGRPVFARRWADLAIRGPDPVAADRLMTGAGGPSRTCSVCGATLGRGASGLCRRCAARSG